MVRENDPEAAPLVTLARAPVRRYAAWLLVLTAWLLASPVVLGYGDHPLALSDRISALLIAIVASAALLRDRSAWAWPAGLVGLWLILSPIVLWAPTALSYASATLTGSLVVTVAFILPATRRAAGPAIPRDWSYNPSTWRQRVPVIVLCIASYAIAVYMASFQLGYIATVRDPVFGDGTLRVLTSDVSRAFPVSDAGLGAAMYLIDLVMTCAGDQRRWRTMPWLVIVFGILIVPVGIVSIVLVILQPLAVSAWCSWCLLTAIATLAMIPLAIDEVGATLQLLRRARADGRNWMRVLWLGDEAGATDAPATPRIAPRRSVWALIPIALAGLWLVVEPAALGTSGTYASSTTITGALLIVIAVIAAGEVARAVRFAAVPLAVWCIVAPFVLSGSVPTTYLSGVLVAAVVLASSLLRIPVRERHGELDRLALWPAQWWPAHQP